MAFLASSNLSNLMNASAESSHKSESVCIDRWYRRRVRVVAWTIGSVGWKMERILVLVPMDGVGLRIERYSAKPDALSPNLLPPLIVTAIDHYIQLDHVFDGMLQIKVITYLSFHWKEYLLCY
jgi:hypothetical protein